MGNTYDPDLPPEDDEWGSIDFQAAPAATQDEWAGIDFQAAPQSVDPEWAGIDFQAAPSVNLSDRFPPAALPDRSADARLQNEQWAATNLNQPDERPWWQRAIRGAVSWPTAGAFHPFDPAPETGSTPEKYHELDAARRSPGLMERIFHMMQSGVAGVERIYAGGHNAAATAFDPETFATSYAELLKKSGHPELADKFAGLDPEAREGFVANTVGLVGDVLEAGVKQGVGNIGAIPAAAGEVVRGVGEATGISERFDSDAFAKGAARQKEAGREVYASSGTESGLGFDVKMSHKKRLKMAEEAADSIIANAAEQGEETKPREQIVAHALKQLEKEYPAGSLTPTSELVSNIGFDPLTITDVAKFGKGYATAAKAGGLGKNVFQDLKAFSRIVRPGDFPVARHGFDILGQGAQKLKIPLAGQLRKGSKASETSSAFKAGIESMATGGALNRASELVGEQVSPLMDKAAKAVLRGSPDAPLPEANPTLGGRIKFAMRKKLDRAASDVLRMPTATTKVGAAIGSPLGMVHSEANLAEAAGTLAKNRVAAAAERANVEYHDAYEPAIKALEETGLTRKQAELEALRRMKAEGPAAPPGPPVQGPPPPKPDTPGWQGPLDLPENALHRKLGESAKTAEDLSRKWREAVQPLRDIPKPKTIKGQSFVGRVKRRWGMVVDPKKAAQADEVRAAVRDSAVGRTLEALGESSRRMQDALLETKRSIGMSVNEQDGYLQHAHTQTGMEQLARHYGNPALTHAVASGDVEAIEGALRAIPGNKFHTADEFNEGVSGPGKAFWGEDEWYKDRVGKSKKVQAAKGKVDLTKRNIYKETAGTQPHGKDGLTHRQAKMDLAGRELMAEVGGHAKTARARSDAMDRYSRSYVAGKSDAELIDRISGDAVGDLRNVQARSKDFEAAKQEHLDLVKAHHNELASGDKAAKELVDTSYKSLQDSLERVIEARATARTNIARRVASETDPKKAEEIFEELNDVFTNDVTRAEDSLLAQYSDSYATAAERQEFIRARNRLNKVLASHEEELEKIQAAFDKRRAALDAKKKSRVSKERSNLARLQSKLDDLKDKVGSAGYKTPLEILSRLGGNVAEGIDKAKAPGQFRMGKGEASLKRWLRGDIPSLTDTYASIGIKDALETNPVYLNLRGANGLAQAVGAKHSMLDLLQRARIPEEAGRPGWDVKVSDLLEDLGYSAKAEPEMHGLGGYIAREIHDDLRDYLRIASDPTRAHAALRGYRRLTSGYALSKLAAFPDWVKGNILAGGFQAVFLGKMKAGEYIDGLLDALDALGISRTRAFLTSAVPMGGALPRDLGKSKLALLRTPKTEFDFGKAGTFTAQQWIDEMTAQGVLKAHSGGLEAKGGVMQADQTERTGQLLKIKPGPRGSEVTKSGKASRLAGKQMSGAVELDDIPRAVLYKHFRSQGMSPAEAGRQANEIAYNIDVLTPTERGGTAPGWRDLKLFYPWFRNNIPAMAAFATQHPDTLRRLLTPFNVDYQLGGGYNPEHDPGWQANKAGFQALPRMAMGRSPVVTEDEPSTRFDGFRSNPEDIAEMADNPKRAALTGLTPGLKWARELLTGHDDFRDQPIAEQNYMQRLPFDLQRHAPLLNARESGFPGADKVNPYVKHVYNEVGGRFVSEINQSQRSSLPAEILSRLSPVPITAQDMQPERRKRSVLKDDARRLDEFWPLLIENDIMFGDANRPPNWTSGSATIPKSKLAEVRKRWPEFYEAYVRVRRDAKELKR